MPSPDRNPLQEILSAPSAGRDHGGIDKVLMAVRTHLGMDVAFVSRFGPRARTFTHVNASGMSPIQPGDSSPMDEGYCQRIVDGRLPQLIPNAQTLPATAALPETRAVPIGAHLSVPIRLSDGRVYGTFCCFSFMPDDSLTRRDLQVMRAFAELLAERIDQDLLHSRRRDGQVMRLTDMMDRGQPSMVFQPIYDLDSGCMAGVEGLARFHSLPLRAPDVWFSEAALVGLGTVLEGRAVTQAVANLPLLPPDTYLSVNGSPQFVVSGALGTALRHVDIRRIVLEITEHAAVADYAELKWCLAPLRALGLRVAIDDTGAGYASMRHILSIDPDIIKLDISLTQGIDQDTKRRALASALIAFARETGIEIIAECVETEAELRTLRALGVSRAQGYHLALPMAIGEVLQATTLLAREPQATVADQPRKAAAASASSG